ncbi:MAG: flagellar basal body rod protein FlgC [Spirochaetes bacterium GWD1_61_31]|nr:MAG: flagellar basal body rod protein FlgC [Spirochaetes bacterium GWB1_60_80]OHD34708.1 MAG: flagellar basal body rod protein FlgC [Spirochaetes bacterium GWC1_61_12]OHD38759.1 MAG: flagellar basal body rod protein FlgC [Spirochaetes bacterium GWD1_61_31]OHD44503.1 MAG: flagellar basal body rod protein FlgC [Spirochaetes bacterium GWE1_60_18]OHD59346.1 MAG: flagellar basal body rod protein FlgC [Spirochaetes bacterium GWF1_60_12]HAP43156.1 flagellar basal body rod protein FlgC [Spirochaeta
MGMFTSINIAASGMTVERIRQDVISNNIANQGTTRTPEGGVFRRSRVVLEPVTDTPYFRLPFLPKQWDEGAGAGVRVSEIQEDRSTETRLVYDPTHPDAIMTGPRAGYVEMPNVNIVTEMVDLIAASRAYEANAAIVNGSKAMFMKALEIGR